MQVHEETMLSHMENVSFYVPMLTAVIGVVCFHYGVVSYPSQPSTPPTAVHTQKAMERERPAPSRPPNEHAQLETRKATPKTDIRKVIPKPSTTLTSKLTKKVKTQALVQSAPKKAIKKKPCPPVFEVYFGVNRRQPRRISRRKMRRLMRWLSRHQRTSLIVQGHTDSRGKAEYNLLLSFRRANAVAALFMKQGLSKKRIRVRALGGEHFSAKQIRRRKGDQKRRVSFRVVAGASFRHCASVIYKDKDEI